MEAVRRKSVHSPFGGSTVCKPWLFLLSGAVLAVSLPFILTPSLPARGQGTLVVEKVEYGGWRNNLRISNGEVELIVTLDVGPRIISYKLAGGKNVFKNYDDQLGRSNEKEWKIRVGKRLWTQPVPYVLAVLRLQGPALEFRQQVHHPAPGQKGPDQDRRRSPDGLGRLPEQRDLVHQALQLRGRETVSRWRRELRD